MLNLDNDRLIENSFVIKNMPFGSSVLDVGSVGSDLSYIAGAFENDVTSIDQRPWPGLLHPNQLFIHGDVLRHTFPTDFDYIIACSTIEHIGLAGRYGSPNIPDGDLSFMKKARTLLNEHGTLALTIPVGKSAVIGNLHRIYDLSRLALIFDGYRIMFSAYYTKNPLGFWVYSTAEQAFSTEGKSNYYALGLFLLGHKTEGKS